MSVAPFVFLHIDKTAGTSIRKSVLEPNVSCEPLGSWRHELVRIGRRRSAVCYHGHVAYGIHRLLRIDPVYVTILREPVDRAVSFYYFIKDLEQTDLFEAHPFRAFADAVTVAEFYENPRFANIQTRRLAGMAFDHAYSRLWPNPVFRNSTLAAAKRHLDAMPVFGLREQFRESQERFLEFVGGDKRVDGLVEKRTKNRRSVEDIQHERPSLIDRLRRSHELDSELYSYAVERFRQSRDPARSDAVGKHARGGAVTEPDSAAVRSRGR